MRRSLRIGVGIAAGAVIVVALLLLEVIGSCEFRVRGPWLVRYTSDRSEVSRKYFLVMNPTRDRRPELIADSVLRRMASGDRGQVEKLFGANRELMLLEEPRFPPVSWVLNDRSESPQLTTIRYWVERRNYPGRHSEVLFTFERQPTLRLVAIDAAY
jgi:hypothetical protein